jgi:hypothetical protein
MDRRTARTPSLRTATAVAAASALMIAAAGCGVKPSATGSSSSSNAGGGSANSKLLAFSSCMRSHGVSAYPDPPPGAPNAKVPSARQLGVSDFKLSGAESACRHLLPPGVLGPLSSSEVQQQLAGMRRFSQCMRSHGIPTWPDPAIGPNGRPGFNLMHVSGGDPGSPQFRECSRLLPSGL